MLEARPDPDNALIWYVTSEDNPDHEYTVDFYNWRCTCRDFECRELPRLKAGKHKYSCQCKHMRASRAALANATLEWMIDQEDKRMKEQK